MTLELFALCDSAREEDGFLHITAITDRAFASRMPLLIEKMCIAWRIRFSTAEIGEYHVTVAIIGEDGKKVGGFEIEEELRISNEAVFRAWNGLLNASDVVLPKFGEYSIRLSLDGEAIGSLPLFVLPAQ